MKEEEKIENDRVKRRNPATEEKIMLKYTIPKETLHFLRFPKLMYYQMGVHPPSNTKVKSWGYIYIYMMIHWETSMIMITYMVSQCLHMEVSPNRATMYYPTSKAWMIRGTRSSDNSH